MRGTWWVVVAGFALACAGGRMPASPGVAEPLPDAMRVVDAEGTAPVIGGDVATARRSAIQQALREAVETALGVAVSARLETRNHAVLEDHIATRASGYAVLDQILSEGEASGTYRVRARVRVSVRPPGVRWAVTGPRQWRVIVAVAPATYAGQAGAGEAAAAVELAAHLQNAGLELAGAPDREPQAWEQETIRLASASPDEVATWGRRHQADIVITGRAAVRAWRGISLPMDWLPIDYTRCAVQLSVRAIRTDTGEILAGETLSAEGEGTARAQAVRACLIGVARRVGRRLTEALLQLPGARSVPVQVTIAGVPGITDAKTLEDVIAGIPVVRRLQRRSFAAGRLVLDLAVAADAAGDLPVILEETLALSTHPVRVESASAGRVAASVSTGQ